MENKYKPFKNELEKINFLWSLKQIKPEVRLNLSQEQLDLLKTKYPDFLIAYSQTIKRIIETFGDGVWIKNI